MGFARHFQRFSPTSQGEWSAGLVQVVQPDAETDSHSPLVLWVEGERVLAVRAAEVSEAAPTLMSTFIDAAQSRGHYPARVRVASAELAAALQGAMPPFVSVVRTPTPEIRRAVEKAAGAPDGPTSADIPTRSGRCVEVPSLDRVAAALLARNPWRLIPSETIFGISSEALGLRDAGLNLSWDLGAEPLLIVFPERGPAAELARKPYQDAGPQIDERLPRLLLTFARVPDTSDDERALLRELGWIPPIDDPDLVPVACAFDGEGRRRLLTDQEVLVLRAAAFAILGMFAEPISERHETPDGAAFSLLLKLDDHCVANVLLRLRARVAKGVASRGRQN